MYTKINIIIRFPCSILKLEILTSRLQRRKVDTSWFKCTLKLRKNVHFIRPEIKQLDNIIIEQFT